MRPGNCFRALSTRSCQETPQGNLTTLCLKENNILNFFDKLLKNIPLLYTVTVKCFFVFSRHFEFTLFYSCGYG